MHLPATRKTIEGRGVQSIEVGGRLLQAMVELAQPSMLRDLAAAAKVTPAQAHAYLVSFRKLGLVEQDAASGRYLLGPFALQLGLARMRSFDPLRLASAAAMELALEMGLMVTISVWGTHGPTVIQVTEAVQPVHVNLRAGAVFTITGTATGRLFGALLPEALVRPLVEAETRAGGRSQAIGRGTSLEAHRRSVAEVRRLGHATTEGVPVPGVNAVAVPVLDHSRQLQFALTVIGHAEALDVAEGSAQLAQVVGFGRKVSAQLGYQAPPVATDTVTPLRRAARRSRAG
ncbi:IclR family transcriptional regulator [Plastoroseomonas hellenica]|uniref:IclR family transcriptional regulator n=1 Tax=Plastoroseomonas hellenica TaxID=2687306 RepID=UPI001BAC4DE0|nr:IclR family transcriptional regulator [Plastoroseomonas hellenica]MBR0642759.1 IclR family transcriptional regulator [Plastoroseomonas hellenica]